MRKINQVIAQAFHNRQPKSLSNTHTDGNAVWLHGNKIIERRGEDIWISAAGWPTTTTKSRINGIVGDYARLSTNQGTLYIYSKPAGICQELDPNEWINIGSVS